MHEVLNGLGKGITRGRLERQKAFLFWKELRALPIQAADSPVDDGPLDLALTHNLATYDASYLSLAISRRLPIATGDGKLQEAAFGTGIDVIKP